KNGATWHGLSAVASPVESGSRWFVIIAGRRLGPWGLKELEGRQKSGEIGRRTYVWRPGMTDWRRGDELSELSSLFDRRDEAGDDEAQAHHLRESFEQVTSTSVSTESRPLAELKLSPSLVAAAPEAVREAEEPPVPDSAPQQTEPSATPGDETRFFIAEAG